MNSASYVKYINFCKRTADASVWKTQKCLCVYLFCVFSPPKRKGTELWDEFTVTYLMRWWLKTCVSVHLTVLATTDSEKTKTNRQSFGCIDTKPTKIHFLFIENQTTPWFVLFSNFSSTWSLDQLFWTGHNMLQLPSTSLSDLTPTWLQ